jgi:hypothetical protein
MLSSSSKVIAVRDEGMIDRNRVQYGTESEGKIYTLRIPDVGDATAQH